MLNQFIEANVDRLMERTRYRPLPSGRMKSSHALMLGIFMVVVAMPEQHTFLAAMALLWRPRRRIDRAVSFDPRLGGGLSR